MARNITEHDLRRDCDAILRAVEQGETFIISLNGTPVAELRPLRERTSASRERLDELPGQESDGGTRGSWLPGDFVHPVHVALPDGAHHLRPIREADTPLDYPAVMGSRERLWSIFGPAWKWPRATMTYEEDRADLLRHEKEIAAHQSFNYALFDAAETVLLGCVYIDPPEKIGADAEIAWWVVDDLVGGDVEGILDAFVPEWIAADWPFSRPRYLGRDITWEDWLALPGPS